MKSLLLLQLLVVVAVISIFCIRSYSLQNIIITEHEKTSFHSEGYFLSSDSNDFSDKALKEENTTHNTFIRQLKKTVSIVRFFLAIHESTTVLAPGTQKYRAFLLNDCSPALHLLYLKILV